jgi:hypothetical protein
MAKLTKDFECVPAGEIYPVTIPAGEECPPEHEAAALALDAIDAAAVEAAKADAERIAAEQAAAAEAQRVADDAAKAAAVEAAKKAKA